MEMKIISPLRFQHTAAEFGNVALVVLTHSRPKVAGFTRIGTRLMREVSTPSRLKAAESSSDRCGFGGSGFNTQPPEGG